MRHSPPSAHKAPILKGTLRVAPFQKPLAARVAVIVAVPAPTMVTRPVVALTVAMAVFELL